MGFHEDIYGGGRASAKPSSVRKGNERQQKARGIWGCLCPPLVNSYYHPYYRGILAQKSCSLTLCE